MDCTNCGEYAGEDPEVERLRARVEELEALLSDMPNAHADPMRDFYNRVLVALYRESGGEGE